MEVLTAFQVSLGAGLALQVLHELFMNVRALIFWKSFFVLQEVDYEVLGWVYRHSGEDID